MPGCCTRLHVTTSTLQQASILFTLVVWLMVSSAYGCCLLQSFKDRLRLPGFGRGPGSTGGSDAGSSLRSAPAGIGAGSKSSRGGLWRWASGGRYVQRQVLCMRMVVCPAGDRRQHLPALLLSVCLLAANTQLLYMLWCTLTVSVEL
jgi:hypothetical protein